MKPTIIICCVVVTTLLALVGCPDSGSGSGSDADVEDGSVPCPAELPPPSDPCIPLCGNEFGVGQPCSKGGFQCPFIETGTEASFCTVDFDDTNLAFCTKPCVDDSDCGADAVCTGDPDKPESDKGCTPASCI
jgi:hypothetical protein